MDDRSGNRETQLLRARQSNAMLLMAGSQTWNRGTAWYPARSTFCGQHLDSKALTRGTISVFDRVPDQIQNEKCLGMQNRHT